MTTDDVDEVAVERACGGDRLVTLNRAETAAAIAECERRGMSRRETGELLGLSDRTVFRVASGATNYPFGRPGATVDQTKEKIAAALKHENIGIRRQAMRANDALAKLNTVLAEWDAKEMARERVIELEQQLAEAKALLRGGTTKPAKPNEHKHARAWARSQGIEVPAIGRVPGDVLDAWRQAGGKAA